MSKNRQANNSPVVLLLDAAEEEITRLRNEIPELTWKEAPEGWPFDSESKSSDYSFQAVMVFAGKDKGGRIFDIYQILCDEKVIDGVPLLIAVSRYQMSLVNKLRKLPMVDCIFTPIEKNKLLDKIKKDSNVIA